MHIKARIARFTGFILMSAGVITVLCTPAYYWYTNSYVVFEFSAQAAQDPILIDEKLLGSNNEALSYPQKIVIPSLSVDLKIKPANVVSGSWEVFENSAGFGLGSSTPDQVGNTVVFAHARDGLFGPLKKIKQGDSIYLFTNDNWYEYRVSEIKSVAPTDTSVIQQTDDQTLTLFTCSGFADSMRLIVVGKKV